MEFFVNLFIYIIAFLGIIIINIVVFEKYLICEKYKIYTYKKYDKKIRYYKK